MRTPSLTRRWLSRAVATCLLLEAGRSARAQAPLPRSGGEVEAYCEHVRAVAASESALLRSPWLFSTFGTLQGGEGLDAVADSGAELSFRLQAGVGFSPTRYYQAGLVDERAAAECDRYRAERDLRAVLGAGDGVPRAAFEAKAKVLREALPRAEQLLAESGRRLEASRSTLEAYAALVLRVDELRRALSDNELAAASLPAEPAGASAEGAFARLSRSEARREAAEGSRRRAAALSIALRGGYDELFGVEQRTPVFGNASLEFNPGWFWQLGDDERARRSHATWFEARSAGAPSNLDQAARQLQARLVLLRERERGLGTTLGDLEPRLERLANVTGEDASEYHAVLWFDVVRLRTERAGLRTQIRTLEKALGETGTPFRVSTNIKAVPSADVPILPGSTRPSLAGAVAKPGTDLGHKALGSTEQP